MSASRQITIRTGARLHFGLWAWGPGHERQFGGVGMIVEQPRFELRLTPANAFEAAGPLAERMRRTAERYGERRSWPTMPACRLEAVVLPPQHAGFGVGTQLSLAVAQGLAAWAGDGPQPATELAVATGRGRRSAIGTHGFAAGGLVVDAGKRASDAVGLVADATRVPDEWRVLLVTPRLDRGKAGAAEVEAFRKLPPVPAEVTAKLQRLAFDEIVPACRAGDFERFAAAVSQYGYTAGMCFAPVQGGAYASEQVARLVARLEQLGAGGVGQSSWGPSVFGFAPNAETAATLESRLLEQLSPSEYTVTLTPARNQGAEIIVAG